MFLDELPRNATGKVLKRELAEYDEDGAPPADDGDASESKTKSKSGSGSKK